MAAPHNDEPTLLDGLDRVALVQKVGDAVAACRPPQVFGIHGDWGAGKTSFLHQLQLYLTGECPQCAEAGDLAEARRTVGRSEPRDAATVVWFEAWRYQHEKAPIVALLHEIRAQLPWYSKALRKAGKLAHVSVRSALLSLEDLTKRIGIQASKIEEAGRQWEEENLASVLPSHMIRQHLEEALRTLLDKREENAGRRLVVLVDDLDRCESEAAYQLLEGIKIYLNLPSCVFVLGMNQQIIEGAVAKHLAAAEQVGEHRLRAREYMEKLCQNIWHLPVAQDPAELLRGYVGTVAGSGFLVKVVTEFCCLPPNPRKVKAYANLLLRFEEHLRALHDQAGEEPANKERWAKLAVVFTNLYHFHPEVYRILDSDVEFYQEELRPWCLGDTSEHEALKHLRRTRRVAGVDPRSPTPETRLARTFPDPAAGDVVRVDRLIENLETVTVTEVAENLLR